MKTEALIAEISDRPASERARIAGAIRATLNQPDSDAQQAWMGEVGRRADEVASGDAEMISQEEFEKIRAQKGG